MEYAYVNHEGRTHAPLLSELLSLLSLLPFYTPSSLPSCALSTSLIPFFSRVPHKPLLSEQRWWLNEEEETREEKNRERTIVRV